LDVHQLARFWIGRMAVSVWGTSARVLLRAGPKRVTIRAVLDTPGYRVVASIWYPGWLRAWRARRRGLSDRIKPFARSVR
jgi:hypothetical protein